MYHLVIADGGKRDGLAYGSFKVYDDRGNLVGHKQHIFGLGTSNQAEYRSLLMALTWCLNRNMLNIVVMMDSKLTIDQVNGDSECRDRILRLLHAKAIDLVAQFDYFELGYMPNKYIKQKLGH